MKINKIKVKSYISRSKIKGIDFVINPYIGCPNGCLYCYAKFLNNLNSKSLKWGDYLDIKIVLEDVKKLNYPYKTYLLSSTTDCYNKYEEKYEITKKVLEELSLHHIKLIIETKNKLILRDLDILKKIKELKVIMSLNTLDDNIRKTFEKDSSIEDRINTLKILNKEKIYTILNISPFLPYITDYKQIINETKEFVKEYHFSFLNLSNNSKREFLRCIKDNYSNLYQKYADIYLFGNNEYLITLKNEIELYCKKNKIICYFASKN